MLVCIGSPAGDLIEHTELIAVVVGVLWRGDVGQDLGLGGGFGNGIRRGCTVYRSISYRGVAAGLGAEQDRKHQYCRNCTFHKKLLPCFSQKALLFLNLYCIILTTESKCSF